MGIIEKLLSYLVNIIVSEFHIYLKTIISYKADSKSK